MKRIKIRGDVVFALLVLAAIVFWGISTTYRDNHEENLLKNKKTTVAWLIDIYHGGVKNPRFATVRFLVGKKYYEVEFTGNYDKFKLKDTILIEYAVEDPSVARVVDKYYMKKYKHLKQ